jgi:hypothetical protein
VVTGDNSENRDLKGSIFRARSEIAGLLMPESRFRRIRKYDRASTNRIGEVAGFSLGSLYPYFPEQGGAGGSGY